MKQISNWVFGSFFRTIGRLLVFVLLGVLIANFVDFGNLKDNFNITNLLGIETIKASEVYDGYTWINTYYSDEQRTNARASEGLFSYFDGNTATSYNANYTYNYNYFNTVDLSNWIGGNVQFEYELSMPQVYTTATSTIYADDYCDRWDWGSIDSFNNVIRWNCARVSQGQDSTITDREYIYPKYSIKAYLMVGNNNLAVPCEVNQSVNRIICPIQDNAIDVHGLRVDTKVFYNTSTNTTYRFKFGKEMIRYRNVEKDINTSINSQTQQQQQQHNETMNYLEDSNTTQAENEASDFFSDFEVEDHGGLSGIITAPLSTIQSLLNNTCTNLVLPLPFVNENLTLPCMNSIYTEHFGAFFTIYQTIILAIISYRCLRSLFYDVRGFINPDDDRIEVMDL